MVESFQVGSGGGKVGNGVVDPPKLRVFAIGFIPVLLLDINLNSGTELWGEYCWCSLPYVILFWEGHGSKGIFSACLL